MSSFTTIATLCACTLLGCAVDGPSKGSDDDDFTDLATTDPKADGFSTKLKLVGSLKQGVLEKGDYTSRPKYRGFTFDGMPGDVIDIFVSMDQGDPIAWVLDSDFRTLAKNDDFGMDTTTARLNLTLPASGSKRHYLVFREVTEEFAKVGYLVDTQRLGGPPPMPPPSCTLLATPSSTTLNGMILFNVLSQTATRCTVDLDGGPPVDVQSCALFQAPGSVIGLGDHTVSVHAFAADNMTSATCSTMVHVDP